MNQTTSGDADAATGGSSATDNTNTCNNNSIPLQTEQAVQAVQVQGHADSSVQDLSEKFKTAASASASAPKDQDKEGILRRSPPYQQQQKQQISSPISTPPRRSTTNTVTSSSSSKHQSEDTSTVTASADDILVHLNIHNESKGDNHDGNHDNQAEHDFLSISPIQTPTPTPTVTGTPLRASKETNPDSSVLDTTQFYTPMSNSTNNNSNSNSHSNLDVWMNNYFPSSNHSVDLSVDSSLDQVDREYLGDARRHTHDHEIAAAAAAAAAAERSTTTTSTSSTQPMNTCTCNANANANTNTSKNTATTPLAYLQVADSQFLGYAACHLKNYAQVLWFVSKIQQEHPEATHIPYAWYHIDDNIDDNGDDDDDGDNSNNNTPATLYNPEKEGFQEDGEPEGSTGPILLQTIRESMAQEAKSIWLFPEESGREDCNNNHNNTNKNNANANTNTVVVIVRYFGTQLLGVTCGRLTQCYQRIAQTTLHRLYHGTHIPQQLNLYTMKNNCYGLAAGDTEVHLNVVEGDRKELFHALLEELDFGGFKGAAGEVLPRLQNLQADFYAPHPKAPGASSKIDNQHGSFVPVYRYPGNYSGDEWETFRWSPLSHRIKEKVEDALPHFYDDQTMNHCVTNYYRHGHDFIAHHSDKDLDLDRTGAIVSVSIGAERILELRHREEPRDLTRVRLPHGSMLLLGPITNQHYTHSIIPAVPDDTATETNASVLVAEDKRISLTMRHVCTFMDVHTQRLFGQGVSCKTLEDLKRSRRMENIYFGLGFGSLWNALRHYSMTTTLLSHSWPHRWLIPWSSSLTTATTTTATSSAVKTTATTTSTQTSTTSAWQSFAQEGLVLLGSMGIAWWAYSKALKTYHRRKEERDARTFFTRTSTSGTKY